MSNMYAWGSTVHGELGVGGIEDEYIYTPRLLEWTKDAKFVKEVACSVNHTIFLTKDGKVYSCGNNDYGQLGHSQPRKRPHLIHDLNAHQITHIACGLYHSMALDTWGKVFTWGSNSFGQLGNPQTEPPQVTPKIVKKLNTSHVLQIACGEQHCLALTSDGNVYAWGANDVGQLGVGTTTPFEPEPVIVSSISGVPFSFIACGSYHSFALSTSGCVFGWGKNSRGQLGLNDRENKMFPQQVRILRNVKVRYISCGEEFSIFLTYDGGVFTCGAGTYGQLGHGNKSDELLPKMIIELMGSTISQVVCGRRHTLAFLSTGGNVYSFGLGSAGQLGLSKDVNKTLIPQNINGPWVSPTSTKSDDTTQFVIQRIFAGGDHCFATITKRKDKITSYDCRLYDPKSQILTLSFEYLQTNLKNEVKNLDPDVMPYLETVFKSLACINASFLLENHKHYCCSSKNHGVNLVKAEETFNFIARSGNEEAKKLIYDTITSDNNLLKKLCSSPPDVETLRAYLILPLYHEFSNARRYEKLQLLYARAVLQLQGPAKKILDRWLTTMPSNQYERIVNCYKGVAIFIIKGLHINKETEIITKNPSLIAVLDFLAKLHSLNKINNQLRIPTETFILPELNEYVDVKLDYLLWLSDPSETTRLYLCNYPYLFDTEAKVTLLQLDTYLQRVSATNEAARRAALTMFLNLPRDTQENQFLQLFIDRNKITDCTIQQLEQVKQTDLRKPLKVKFLNEDGEDAGGVKKEFFLLVLRDILDPKYGMFMSYDESTRFYWFMPQPLESSHMFGLIGMICGLAIYNSITIYLPFPLAMYKKILKEEATLADLCELNPIVGNSMKAMLDYEGHNFEDVFCEIYFEISYSNLGEAVSVDLIPNGKNVRVTLENRQDYVKHYVDFIFNRSCKQQFEAFRQQFVRVCESRVMKLFQAYELMALVTGNENYDWFKLQEVAKYKDGYSSSDPQIVWFWEVIHEMTLKQKKDFLLFLTGTDRVPIQGMGEIEIEIQPMADDRYLPVAHTCTHQLDLPKYRTKERLKYKLLQAIQHNQGFTIV